MFEHHYKLIQIYYKDQKAKRSGVPYMNHIDEGLVILNDLGATDYTKSAYCIHPILQDDDKLHDNYNSFGPLIDPKVLFYTMEYRNVANRGLSCYQVDNPASIYLGPLKEVHQLLISDKCQNRKDFITYHLGTHRGSIELDHYFKNWLRALGVLEAQYQHYCQLIDLYRLTADAQQMGLYDPPFNNPLIKEK